MNRSLYVIKPEAMLVRDRIRNLIFRAGLKILRTAELVVPGTMLDLLYTDLTSDLRTATQMFMGRAACEIGEVEGEDAVNRLLVVCGHFTDPSKCDAQSIRGLFGIRQAERVGSAVYFKNAIHRPKTHAEAKRDLLLFLPLLTQTGDSFGAP